MIDKKTVAVYAAVTGIFLLGQFYLYSGNTDTGGGATAALEHLGEQQYRASWTADRISRGLDDSRGTVADLNRANADVEKSISAAEGTNQHLAGSINNAVGRLARAERLLDDSKRRITACKEILSENREGAGQDEKEK